VYNTICDILRKEEVDNDDDVTYHAASIQLIQAYPHFQSDGSYTDERILQHCQPLVEYDLNVNWNDNCFKPILAMELKTSGKMLLLFQNERANSRDSLTSITRRWPCRKSISWTCN
jgi:hypothetical protein